MRSIPVVVALLVASPAFAQVDRWSIDVEAVSLDAGGNDRLVLADRSVAAGGAATQTTHTLDAGSALGYRAELHRAGNRWRFGVDFHIALGAGAFFAAWTDLAVPPGVEAGSTLDTLDENTLELFGASGGVTVRF